MAIFPAGWDSFLAGPVYVTDTFDAAEYFRHATAAAFGALTIVREAASVIRRGGCSISDGVGRQLRIQSQIMAHASLREISTLQSDWNGYGAIPVDSEIIAASSEFINECGSEFPDIPRVVPMTRGRLQFEWHRGNRSLEIEFEDPLTIHYLKWDSDLRVEEEDTLEIADQGAIKGLLKWFSSE
jgi:hypothetical protein